MKNIFGAPDAVSEIIGTLIMITFAVTVFSAVSLYLLNPTINSNEPDQRYVNLVGSVFVDPSGIGGVILEHRGGEQLPANTQILITIGASTSDPDQKSYSDINPDDPDWNIGERVDYVPDVQPVEGMRHAYVKVTVIDPETNTVLMDQVLQDSLYVVTLAPTDICEDGINWAHVTFHLAYDFRNVNPQLVETDADVYIEYAPTVSFNPEGGNSRTDKLDYKDFKPHDELSFLVTNLGSAMSYTYRARLTYTDTFHQKVELKGELISFWTYEIDRGKYTFEADSGSTIIDESIPNNPGTAVGEIRYADGHLGSGSKALDFHTGFSREGEGSERYVQIPYHDKLNLRDKLTVDTWVKIEDENFVGKLTKINEVLIKNINHMGMPLAYPYDEPDVLHIAGDVYAIAYQAPSNKTGGAYLFTFHLDTSGNVHFISNCTLLPLTLKVREPRLFKVGGTLYGVAFGTGSDSSAKGWRVVTLTISDAGDIPSATIKVYANLSSLPHYQGCGSEPDVVFLSNDQFYAYFALSYGGSFDSHTVTGQVHTIKIKLSDGVVTYIASWWLQERNKKYLSCWETDIVRVAPGLYAVAFSEKFTGINCGHILTLKISDVGVFYSMKPFSTYNFPTDDCLEPCFIEVNPETGIFALVYGRISSKISLGLLQTFSVDQMTGTISLFPEENLQFCDSLLEANITRVSDSLYAIVYSDTSGACKMATVEISSHGEVISYKLDELLFNNPGFEPSIVKLFDSIDTRYVAIYGGMFSDGGIIGVVEVDTIEFIDNILEKAQVFSLQIKGVQLVGTLWVGEAGFEQPYTISGLIKTAWTHIVLKYDSGSTTVSLYIDDIEYKEACSGPIKTSFDDIFFGPFNGYLDDVIISHGERPI
jgi:hypothetical protein